MISFITSFKPFDAKYNTVQRSALYTWQRHGIQVYSNYYTPGWWDDPELAARRDKAFEDFDVHRVPDVKVGCQGQFPKNDCPFLNDLLKKALPLIETPMVGLINSDIILPFDWRNNFNRLIWRYGTDCFLTSTKRDIDLVSEVDSKESYKQLQMQVATIGNEINSAEIFIASKEIFEKMAADMAPMIMGRYGWDNWIHFWAVANVPTHLNSTYVLPALHCIHDHDHIEEMEGKPGRKALSSVHNLTHLRNMQNRYGNTVRINKWQYAEI